MGRISNWPGELARYLEARSDVPFEWGFNDCALFACDWIKVLTGRDPATELGLRGTYSDADGAAAILAQYPGGLRDLPGAAGFAEIPVAYAQRGDVVLVQTKLGATLCVHGGARVFGPGPDGSKFFFTHAADTAWKIE